MLAMSAWSIMGGCEASLPTIRDGGTQSNSYSKGRGTVLALMPELTRYPPTAFASSALAWNTHNWGTWGSPKRRKRRLFLPQTHHTAITPRHQSFQPHRGVQAPGKHKSFGVCNSSMKTTNYSLYYSRKPKQVKPCFVEQWKTLSRKWQRTPQRVHNFTRAGGFTHSIIWWDPSSVWLTQNTQQPQQKAEAVERFFKPNPKSPAQTQRTLFAARHWTLPT